MKGYLDSIGRPSASFFPLGDTDIKIKGSFSGKVWLESQMPGETSWEKVPGAITESQTQFSIIVNDLTIRYRFNSNLESGRAIVYAGGVTQTDEAVTLGGEDVTIGGVAATW